MPVLILQKVQVRLIFAEVLTVVEQPPFLAVQEDGCLPVSGGSDALSWLCPIVTLSHSRCGSHLDCACLLAEPRPVLL